MLAGPDLVAVMLNVRDEAGNEAIDTGDKILVDVVIENAGNGAAGIFTVDVSVDDESRWTLTQLSPVFQSGRTVSWDPLDIGQLPEGEHTVELVIDPGGEVAESNDSNNIVSRTFTVTLNDEFRPDLRVGSLRIRDQAGNDRIDTGDNILVDVVVENAGNGAAGVFTVDVLVDDEPRWTLTQLSPLFQSGGTVSWDPLDIGQLPEGEHTVELVIDPGGEVAENNDSNNIVSRTFTVTLNDEFRPDLRVGSLWVRHEAGNDRINTGDNILVDVVVENAGNGVAGVFTVDVLVDDEPRWTLTQLSPVFQPGQTVTWDRLEIGQLLPGAHHVDVVVDPVVQGRAIGQVREGDERNNHFVGDTFWVSFVLESASLSGVKWFDKDDDGIRDVGEPGMVGWTIYLDLNENDQLDAGEPSVITRADDENTEENEAGTYTFTGVAPGTYTIAEVLRPGFEQRFPGPEQGLKTSFNIDLRFVDESLTPEQQAVVLRATQRWEQIIIGDLPDSFDKVNPDDIDDPGLFVDDLVIDVLAETLDGRPPIGNTLGQGGPDQFRNDSMLPTRGTLRLDMDDLPGMSDEKILTVATHEIGHVLGVGTLWENHGLLDADGHYIGQNALAEYNEIFGNEEGHVPVEQEDGHWRETIFDTELMTPDIAAENPLSRITVASLVDLGYEVNLNHADTFAPPGSNLPLVNVAVSGEAVLEEGAGKMQFVVTRTSPADSELLVRYRVSGTAVEGEDFEDLSSSIIIPAGEISGTINVSPGDDDERETKETVELILTGSDAYVIGSQKSASVSILDNEPPELSSSFHHVATVRPGESKLAVDFASPPWPGDANGDGEFNQFDVVAVLQAGKYRAGKPADWAEGDWNRDQVFDQLDIVKALQTGSYLQGRYLAMDSSG